LISALRPVHVDPVLNSGSGKFRHQECYSVRRLSSMMASTCSALAIFTECHPGDFSFYSLIDLKAGNLLDMFRWAVRLHWTHIKKESFRSIRRWKFPARQAGPKWALGIGDIFMEWKVIYEALPLQHTILQNLTKKGHFVVLETLFALFPALLVCRLAQAAFALFSRDKGAPFTATPQF
jgi:hypothetical protein